MNRLVPFATGLAALALAASVFAQDAAQKAPVPPPPGLDDPGVQSRSAPARASTTPDLSGLPPLPTLGGERDGRGEPPPTLTTRKQGQDTVEEYRINGKLYMVRIVPRAGVPQTFLADPEGRLHSEPGQPPVKPVYYKIYEWGKPRKAESGDDGR